MTIVVNFTKAAMEAGYEKQVIFSVIKKASMGNREINNVLEFTKGCLLCT